MDEQVERLVSKVRAKLETLPESRRLLIAVSGIPGSGKTTLASRVSSNLNAIHRASAPGLADFPPAGFIPMDGYHLTRAQLSEMPDPAAAHARRGAAFTFDGMSFLDLVRRLREPICPETTTLYAPGFDHAVKDPVADEIPIPKHMRVILFEGNYLSLARVPWKEAAGMMDELWFVEVDFEVARRRLVARHLKAGIAKDEEEANRRATDNDLVNGKEIVENRLEVQEMIVSNEDDLWKPEAQGV
ncbi:P-loop containing nucleoside triphosphate hydrolase protein [Eremomyces bilateralis CBS 781.70]|uniref:P-loop containing nucleoside triphosphate hydrolase protein n=1 Tax=Eremomyces bilateralis CBS 781.70 TaxID=1392243 RepID=A0A6G1FWL7_9PEZI|nr:P-loop containing nucleoside triphosphate hydrolase protein [Eremomyces bilateralis CBS 781.70]KAF1810128.1 P-loop containing nucleoside triphosphate hydrolase protein [Eremomyces bilateralis CBS 781.70]